MFFLPLQEKPEGKDEGDQNSVTSDIPDGAIPKKEEGEEKEEGEGKRGDEESGEDKEGEGEREGSYDLVDGPSKEQSEVVNVNTECLSPELAYLYV